jgi:hypothetical protein
MSFTVVQSLHFIETLRRRATVVKISIQLVRKLVRRMLDSEIR